MVRLGGLAVEIRCMVAWCTHKQQASTPAFCRLSGGNSASSLLQWNLPAVAFSVQVGLDSALRTCNVVTEVYGRS